MSLRLALPLACCAVFNVVGPSLAHHSFSAVFDLTAKLTVIGTLAKMDWRNPHIELVLEATGDRGQVETWMVEGMPPSFFRNRSVAKSDFEAAIGKTLIVEGMRARDGAQSVLMLKITFPDGKAVTTLDLPAPASSPAPNP